MSLNMDTKAILETLNNFLGLDVSLEDFSHPKPQRVQIICRAFILNVFEVHESSLNELPLLPSLSPDENPEDFHRASPLIMLFCTMKQFIEDMKKDFEFGMPDLISPEPKRFRLLMACLADYLKFQAALAPTWNSTCAIYEEKRVRLAQLHGEVQEMTKIRDALAVEKEARKRREHELLTDLGKKQQELQTHFSRTKELEDAYEANQKFKENQVFIQEELNIEKENLEMQLEQLSLQILASPDRVLKETDQYKEELAKLREHEAKQRKVNEETKSQITMTSKIEEIVEKMGGSSEEKILKLHHALEQAKMTRVDRQQSLGITEDNLRKLTKDNQTAEEELFKCDEHLTREKLMQQQRMEELHKRRTELGGEIADLKQGRSDPAVERQLHAEIADVKSLRAETIARTKEVAAQVKEECTKLFELVRDEAAAFEREVAEYKHLQRTIELETGPSTDLNETANQ